MPRRYNPVRSASATREYDQKPPETININYQASPIISAFHHSDAFYRGIRGPVRSGKSTGMSIEVMSRAHGQDRNKKGMRNSRWGVVRNTYRELEDTTLKTWLMWFPEDIFGRVNKQSMTHILKFNDVNCEVMFRALDRPDDVQKLLSLELTGAWVNEAREVPKAIIDVLGDRVEQFPPLSDGGCSWGGVFMDTNSPDEDHWWHALEMDPPPGWEFFIQPGGLREIADGVFVPNERAENVSNLKGGHDYYIKRMAGKRPSYIRVYYCNQYGYAEDGKRVHPEYSDSFHCAHGRSLQPEPGLPIVIGLDFGLTPAAAICQKSSRGQWRILDEIATEDIGVRHFGEMLLLPLVLSKYLDYEMHVWGDPGSGASQNDKQTPFDILNNLGLDVKPAPTNDPRLRRESLAAPLERVIDGEPGLIVDPKCSTIRKGLSSKYIYRRVQVTGDEKYHDKPDKNYWSHICEALEYAMLGEGEGKRLTRKPNNEAILESLGVHSNLIRTVRGGWMR